MDSVRLVGPKAPQTYRGIPETMQDVHRYTHCIYNKGYGEDRQANNPCTAAQACHQCTKYGQSSHFPRIYFMWPHKIPLSWGITGYGIA